MKKVLVIIFDKFEEIEALASVDIFRRAGFDTTLANIGDTTEVEGRSAIKVFADTTFDTVKNSDFDAIVVSGGSGTYNVLDNVELLNLLQRHKNKGAVVAAICAAPLVLARAGVLSKLKCTGHTSIWDKLENCDSSSAVVNNLRVITSQGAGTAIEFALAIVEELSGKELANDIAKSICFIK